MSYKPPVQLNHEQILAVAETMIFFKRKYKMDYAMCIGDMFGGDARAQIYSIVKEGDNNEQILSDL